MFDFIMPSCLLNFAKMVTLMVIKSMLRSNILNF